MIIRILGEGQYRLSESSARELDRRDNALLEAVEQEDSQRYESILAELLAFIREQGERVGDEELVPSDAVLPGPDLDVREAHKLLEAYPEDLFSEEERA